MSRRWDEAPLAEARQLADLLGANLRASFEIWDLTQDPRGYVVERVPNFFEDLSVLEQAGAIDFGMIRMSLGRGVLETWELWEPTIQYLRERWGDREIYVHFEALARSMEHSFEEEPAPQIEEMD